MEVYTDPMSLVLFGQRLLEEGHEEMAETVIRRALTLDSSNPAVKEAHRDLNERLVNRWHFAMLNDITRNIMYYKAIKKAVNDLQKPVILDIGSGTGILSMMAVREGADHAYGCDMSHVMVRLSRDIAVTNQMQGKLTLLHALSTDLSIPKDLPNRVSLVVTEMFDAGLLGECIIPTLRHAWKELLLHVDLANEMAPSCHVIPCGATVYVCAIECSDVRKKTRLVNPLIGQVLDTKGVCLFGSCKQSNEEGVSPVLVSEPYTTEDLSNIKGGVAFLTPPTSSLQFDFTDPKVPLPDPVKLCLPVIKSGTVDAVAVWFDLHLNPLTSLSTSPSSKTRWEQAIFPLEKSLPLLVETGDELTVQVECSDSQIFVNKTEVSATVGRHNRPISSPLNTLPSFPVLSSSDSTNHSFTPLMNPPVLFIERSELSRLNDTTFVGIMVDAIKEVLLSLSDLEGELRVIDISQGLTLFGMITALVVQRDCFVLVNCSPLYSRLLDYLTSLHQSVKDKVLFTHSLPLLADTSWDLTLISDLITPQGTLSQRSLLALNKIDTEDCVLIPSSIDVVLVGVSSPAMRAMSCVLGSIPTAGFDIAQHINEYQITHLTDADLNTIPNSLLTDATVVYTLDLSRPPSNITKHVSLEITTDNTLTGIAYWFNIRLHGNHMLSTGPNHYSESHWHQAVFLAPEDITVTRGQNVKLVFKLVDGCMDITLDSE